MTLVTFFADCVPLYFLDRKRRAIGLAHSGWRGTVNRMGQAVLSAMEKEYGTDPADVTACIGPSICQDCYEVGEEVIAEFAAAFREEHHPALFYKKRMENTSWISGRPTRIVLREAGVRRPGISVTDICTHCNPELLFSHRTSATGWGNLCAFPLLKGRRQIAGPGFAKNDI